MGLDQEEGLFDKIDAKDLLLNRAIDMFFLDAPVAFPRRPEPGLADQVGNLVEPRGELVVVAGQAHTVLDHGSHRVLFRPRLRRAALRGDACEDPPAQVGFQRGLREPPPSEI